jgi:hypothetical protein
MAMHIGEAFLYKPKNCDLKVRIHTPEIRRKLQRSSYAAPLRKSINVPLEGRGQPNGPLPEAE